MDPPVPQRRSDGVLADLAARCDAARAVGEVASALGDATAAIAPEHDAGVLVRASPVGQWQLLAGTADRAGAIAASFQRARRALEARQGLVDVHGGHHVPLRGEDGGLAGALAILARADGQQLAQVERQLIDEAVVLAAGAFARTQLEARQAALAGWRAALATVPRLALATDRTDVAFDLFADAVAAAVPGSTASIRIVDHAAARLVPVQGEEHGRPAERRIAQMALDLDRLVIETPPAAAILPASARQAAAAPIHDGRRRRIGVVSIDMPIGGAIRGEEDVRDLAVLADVLAVGLDAVRSRRALAVHERLDEETGCYDGARLGDQLTAALEAAATHNDATSVLLVQVDREGGAHDPAFAQLIARRLVELPTLERKLVFRLGTWRFAVVSEGLQRAGAMQLSSRIRLLLRHGVEGQPTACVGVAVAPRHGRDATTLLAAAGAALDAARDAGPDADAAADDPAAAVHRTSRHEHDAVEDEERRRALRALAEAVDDAHFDGAPHAEAVADRVRAICVSLGADPELTAAAVLAGELHDVGRAVMPRALFERRGLAPQELQAVLNHVVLGARLLDVCGFGAAAEIVRRMHERWDGTGFPEGLAGAEIPLGARVLAVANAFETVLNDLGRGDAGLGSAVATVRARRGSAFDPAIVDALLRLVGRAGPMAAAS